MTPGVPAGRTTARSRAIREDYDFLVKAGYDLTEIAERMGMRRDSLRDIIRRQDRKKEARA